MGRKARPARLGVVVNPIAGLGGRVGLKGTDGAETLARARELGAVPDAVPRCAAALACLAPLSEAIEVIVAPGELGEVSARAAGLSPRILSGLPAPTGDAGDTRRAAAALLELEPDLLLFAGGDGTARDVLASVGNAIPILGVPTGVKMHSAVFGTTPRAAGRTAAKFLAGEARLREAEVMDLDEEALREGRVSASLYGVARVPHERGLMQACKAGARPDDEAALDALARVLARDWPREKLMILACGTTLRRVKRALGGEGTLLGVDVALDGRLIATDVNEAQLLRLMERAPAGIVAGATGGQGFLFGRGNQQISAEVIRRVGREGITVMAGQNKLAALDPPVLHVDTGDAEVDAMLAGYTQVHTAPGQRMVMRIASPD
ncbi:ATP-NAD kinase family protein [Falsiroseomonas sp. HW251]|uniref:ATP-NAD kinase family protein n=1 Tax=Falsiroseomonas sp. HW251 TaxID=3390998 RepID=UPI003D316F2D